MHLCTEFAWSGLEFFGAWLLKGKAALPPLVRVGWSTLGCRCKRLDVPELSEERVLVVVAAARHNPSLFIELAYFTERQRHATACRFQPAKCPVVAAFRGELGDDDITRVNVFGVGDAGVRETRGPGFRL